MAIKKLINGIKKMLFLAKQQQLKVAIFGEIAQKTANFARIWKNIPLPHNYFIFETYLNLQSMLLGRI